jgi:subtilisin family serine protease
MFVASAGNDSTSQSRVDARYPAAFSNVIGVGALPKGNPRIINSYIPASYSNLADNPPTNGFMTFGGEPGQGQGIRGMYISNFPGLGNINPTGWAWWAGTSFAAAIITGFLAAEISSSYGFRPPNPGETIPPGPYQTARGEPVILVNQG